MSNSPHLHPRTELELELPLPERIKAIRSARWIGYPAAKAVLDRMEELVEFPQNHRMPCLLLVGESNNGKTMLLRHFFKLHKFQDVPGQSATLPALYAQCPASPDERDLYSSILERLRLPHNRNSRAHVLRTQLEKAMRALSVRMMVLDEVHNVLVGTPIKQKQFLNTLKYLSNELEIPIVAAGTKNALQVTRTDDQIANRFEPMFLPTWKLNDEFRRLLVSFEMMLPLRQPSKLSQEPLLGRIYMMSEGLIGEVSTILVRAGVTAVQNKEECVTSATLDALKWIPPSERRGDIPSQP
jgi:hypothetical protein